MVRLPLVVSALVRAPSVGPEPGPGLAFALAIGIAAVHVFAGRLRVLNRIPRSRWLSFAGGISVAYVFVHLLPELQAGAETVEGSDLLIAAFFERHVYLVALVGFTSFYGLERLATRSQRGDAPLGIPFPDAGVFWTHMGLFGIYNTIIGYLLHDQAGSVEAALFAIAMALHFVVNDFGLRDDYEGRYHDVGRWLLSGAVVAGAAIGTVIDIAEPLVAVLVAFLAGGVILNVIKEELPEEAESRWWAFASGVVGYTTVLILV